MDIVSSLGDALDSAVNSTLPILALPAEDVDSETCRLLGPVALVVQSIMGVLVIGSLLLKRLREKPRRKWRVWIGDVSKQVVGQAFVHMANVAISDVIASHKSDNPCSLYALNIAVDTTIGVLILFCFLKLLTSVLKAHYPTSFRTGDYGNPFDVKIWAKQAAVYVLALSLMKVVVVIMFWAIPGMFEAANWCLSWLSSDEAQVVFVMLIFPLIMNVIQFLIIDSFLKLKPETKEAAFVEDEESRRGFLEHSSDSDDEDTDTSRPALTRGHLKSQSKERTFDPTNSPPAYGGVTEEETPGSGSTKGSASGSGTTTPTPTTRAKALALGHSYPPSTSSESTESTPKQNKAVRIKVPMLVSPPPIPEPLPAPPLLFLSPPMPSSEEVQKEEEDDGERSSFDDWDEGLVSEKVRTPVSGRRIESVIVKNEVQSQVRWATVEP